MLNEALDATTEPLHKGQLLLARSLAQQGATDMMPAASDAQRSVPFLLEGGAPEAAAFATACAAGMIQRTGDTAGALDLAVEAMVMLPEGGLVDENSVRASNAMALLFLQISAFDLAISSARRAFEGAMQQPDSNTRSVVSFTLGISLIEAIRSGGQLDHTDEELDHDLTQAIEWLTSPEAGAMERALLGSGMRAERTLLRQLSDSDGSMVDGPQVTIATDRSELLASLILLERGASAYPESAPRLTAWHQLVTASVLRQLGEADRAEHLLTNSILQLKATTDEHRIVRALNERSIARTMNNNLLGALDDAREVGALTRQWQQRQGARLGAQIARRAELEQARSTLRRRADDLAKQASEDPVTGLATRRWLEMRLDELSRTDQMGTVVVLDLDRFKEVNDTFGHQTGDVVLAEVGRLLRKIVRAETPVARFGGEEFVILLPGTDGESGMALAERVRLAVNQFDWSGVASELTVTVSAGVAYGPLAGVRELLRLADTALYEAKRAGRDRVVGL